MNPVPLEYQRIKPDIRLRINSYKVIGDKNYVVPVDVYTYRKSIDIFANAIVDTVLEEKELIQLIKTVDKSKRQLLKNEFEKILLQEIFISKVNPGCWELLVFLGGLFGTITAWMLKPSFEYIGNEIKDNITKPLIDKTQFFKRVKDRIQNVEEQSQDLNITSKYIADEKLLDIRVFNQRSLDEKKLEELLDSNPYTKFFKN